ncbi:MAG: ribosome small subunit-dependent GTPase A [Luteitalea sp.]|nr:ribosome small subunit-dependent GTPase A [Luteitalea sp.]
MSLPARLVALGWDEPFAHDFHQYAAASLVAARVVAEHQHIYRVSTAEADVLARVAGRARHRWRTREEFPAVGDWVAIRLDPRLAAGSGSPPHPRPTAPDATPLIEGVLPRRSRFSRKVAGRVREEQVVAANVDTVFLVSGLDHDFNLRRIERYLVTASAGGAAPVIVLNKADVCDDVDARQRDVKAIAPGVPVVIASARRGDGFDDLRAHVQPRRTIAFLGSSGVGKSSLINALLGEDRQLTREVRASDQRGRHATTHRELIVMPGGGLLIDTPGMRELHLWEHDGALDAAFPDIDALAADCHFTDCTHDREPRCAVKQAVAEGRLPAVRLEQYRKLRRELKALRSGRGTAGRGYNQP